MATFHHNALNPDDEEIRLLSVDLQAGQHKITRASLNGDYPPYTALSYPWGSFSTTETISVDGSELSVTSNLFTALDNVISFWRRNKGTRDRPLYLWCDQICIDQASEVEKNHQVAFMGLIYYWAEQVIVWLPLSKPVRSGFKSWRKWKAWHQKHVQRGTTEVERYGSSSQMRYSLDQDPEEKLALGDMVAAWEHISTIVQSPWWSRVWVFQEYVLATRATFLFEGLSVPSEELRNFLTGCFTEQQARIQLSKDLSSRPSVQEAPVEQRMNRCAACTGFVIRPPCSLCNACFKPFADLDLLEKGLRGRVGLVTLGSCCCEVTGELFAPPKDECEIMLTLMAGGPPGALAAILVWTVTGLLALGAGLVTLVGCCFACGKGCSDAALKKIPERSRSPEPGLGTVEKNLPWATLNDHIKADESCWENWDRVRFVLDSRQDVQSQRTNAMPMRLSNLIPHARNCFCTDKRDRIYAFLGLLHPDYALKVNYAQKNTCLDVFTEVIIATVRLEQSLNILLIDKEIQDKPAFDENWPSWVPDLSVPAHQDTKYQEFLRSVQLSELRCRAAQDTKPIVSFHPNTLGHPNRILKVHGVRVDTLLRLIPSDVNQPWRRFEGSSGRFFGTPGTGRENAEVWVLLGLDAPVVLLPTEEGDHMYTLLGHAMIWEQAGSKESPILQGSMIDELRADCVTAEPVYIV